MSDFQERFLQLSGDIEELRRLVDESESKLKIFNEIFSQLGKKDEKDMSALGNKNLDLYMDFIRNQITIIRKIVVIPSF